jgi:hypothetical protein
MFWRTFLALAGNRNPDRETRSKSLHRLRAAGYSLENNCEVIISIVNHSSLRIFIKYKYTKLHVSVCGRLSDCLRAGRSGDRIPVGARFFAHIQTGPGVHPASWTMGTGSFPGVKRPGRGADHPPPSSAEIKKE